MFLAQPQLVQSQILEILDSGELECLAGAVDRTTISDKNALRLLCHRDEMLHSASDTRESGHLSDTFLRMLASDSIRQLIRIGTTGKGINDGLCWFPGNIIIFHKFVLSPMKRRFFGLRRQRAAATTLLSAPRLSIFQ